MLLAFLLLGEAPELGKRRRHGAYPRRHADDERAQAGRGGRCDFDGRAPAAGGSWLVFAVLSAVFASLTAILGKVGIEGVESNLGTAVRTIVVLVMSWVMVAVTGKAGAVRAVPRRELFICLLRPTRASWLCYYKALQDGLASVVVPIDKLEHPRDHWLFRLVFGEKLTARSGAGLALIVVGTLLMVFVR